MYICMYVIDQRKREGSSCINNMGNMVEGTYAALPGASLFAQNTGGALLWSPCCSSHTRYPLRLRSRCLFRNRFPWPLCLRHYEGHVETWEGAWVGFLVWKQNRTWSSGAPLHPNQSSVHWEDFQKEEMADCTRTPWLSCKHFGACSSTPWLGCNASSISHRHFGNTMVPSLEALNPPKNMGKDLKNQLFLQHVLHLPINSCNPFLPLIRKAMQLSVLLLA